MLSIFVVTWLFTAITLASENTLRLGTTNSPDTPLFQQAQRILSSALTQLGYKLVITPLPNKRSLFWANKGKIDGVLFRVNSLDLIKHSHLEQVKEPLFIIDQSVFSKKPIKVNGWSSMAEYVVAYERGTQFIEQNHDKFKKVILVDDLEQAMTLISDQRADLTVTSKATGQQFLAKHEKFSELVHVQKPPLVTIALHVYLNKPNHPNLASQLTKKLKEMKTSGEYQILLTGQ